MTTLFRAAVVFFLFLSFHVSAQEAGDDLSLSLDEPAAAKVESAPVNAEAAPVSEEVAPGKDAFDLEGPKESAKKDDSGEEEGRVLSGTAKTADHSRPLYFDPLESGLVALSPEVEYDLTLDEGKTLRLGNIILNEKTFFFSLLPLRQAHPHISKVVSPDEGAKLALIMKYPPSLIEGGNLEMISRTGRVLWSLSITEKMRKQWDEKVELWRRALRAKGVSEKEIGKTGLFGVQYAELDLKEKKSPFGTVNDNFRFCLSQQKDKGSARMCSQWYGTRGKGSSVQMGLIRVDDVEPRVLLRGKQAVAKGSYRVASDSPTAFFAELRKGQSYEFLSVPQPLELVDVADDDKTGKIKLTGVNARPTSPTAILNPDRYKDLTLKMGFQDTIGDFRKFWMALLDKNDPHIFMPGVGGGVFKQKFEVKSLPPEKARPYLRTQTPSVTYSANPVIYGQRLANVELTTEQVAIELDEDDKYFFEWEMQAKNKGDFNKSYLTVNYEGKQYKAYQEIYRGFSSELSGRFTGVATSNGLLIMGEAAYNKWFESLFGLDSYWLSRLRWGISAKYFQAFSKLAVNSEGSTAALNVLNVDLKYRFQPGIWGRDETVGAIVSYQDVTYDKLRAPMFGVGAFWARSMPKVFDDLFNYLPFMEYPKFVDMEFIFYPATSKPGVALQGNFALNFHGKVLWTKTFFGEAGFGMKRYAFQDVALNQKAALNTFYGTMGLGINF